uniref:Uncharacterized protein n=1 Tax=Rhizophora mucronata TaxID=61149 RepID=A0A2P2JNX0_RHIMU
MVVHFLLLWSKKSGIILLYSCTYLLHSDFSEALIYSIILCIIYMICQYVLSQYFSTLSFHTFNKIFSVSIFNPVTRKLKWLVFPD